MLLWSCIWPASHNPDRDAVKIHKIRPSKPRLKGLMASKQTCKPDSVPLAGVAVIYLGRPLPDASCGLPGGQGERAAPRAPKHSPLLGLAPGGGYLAGTVTSPAGGLLHHLFTLTRIASGGMFLWPYPSSHPAWLLASTVLCGVRTFLTRSGRDRPACLDAIVIIP